MIFAANIPPIFYLAGAFLFLLTAGLALWKRGASQPFIRMLVLYAVLAAALFVIEYYHQIGWLWMFRPDVLAHTPMYAFLLLAWAFLGFINRFLQRTRDDLKWWLACLLPAAALIYLDSNPTGALPDVLWQSTAQILPRLSFGWYAMQVGTGLLIATAALLVWFKYAHTPQPLHRNRLNYLMPILAIQAISAGMLYGGHPLAAYGLQVLTLLLMVTLAWSHQFPDLRQISRQFLSYTILTLITTSLFAAAILAAVLLFTRNIHFSPFWIGAGFALILSLVFNPLSTLIRRAVNRLLDGPRYNPAQAVQEYSRSISNILDMELLASVVIGSVRGTLGISRGYLALVERDEVGEKKGYRIKDIHQQNRDPLPEGILSFNGPVTLRLVHEHHPLAQYDIDLLPEFQASPKEDRDWFAHTGMDVYVPISAHGEWIGLLMVGPKVSGDRYFEEDLLLLGALANQTAVALENARLVRHLVELNNELQKAYLSLNKANQQLEKLDRIKTDFINVSSHELRTPLTLLLGYSDMLLTDRDIQANPFHWQLINGIRSGTTRLHEIVGSMLDIARIDSRTLDLAPKFISLPLLIRNSYGTLEKAMKERKISFEAIELTDLPMIEADPEVLQKVFDHLLTNAVKFTPDGGKIKVMERLVSAEESPLAEESVKVVVSDTGIGIEPEIQELIFTKFYQSGPVNLHSTGRTKFKGGGPGLGLAIVRGIVEAHNGRVWVESTGYDEKACPGSQFHVLLPLKQPERSLPSEVSLQESAISR